MNSDGSGVINLTNDPGADQPSDWAPDGSFVVFTSTRDDSALDVYRVSPVGTGVTRLTTNDGNFDGAASVSRSSTRIAYGSGLSLPEQHERSTLTVQTTPRSQVAPRALGPRKRHPPGRSWTDKRFDIFADH